MRLQPGEKLQTYKQSLKLLPYYVEICRTIFVDESKRVYYNISQVEIFYLFHLFSEVLSKIKICRSQIPIPLSFLPEFQYKRYVMLFLPRGRSPPDLVYHNNVMYTITIGYSFIRVHVSLCLLCTDYLIFTSKYL